MRTRHRKRRHANQNYGLRSVRRAKLEDDGNRVLVLAWPAYQEMRIMGLLAISYGDSAKGCSRGQTQARSGSWPLGTGSLSQRFALELHHSRRASRHGVKLGGVQATCT
jgi:hypothetical protein